MEVKIGTKIYDSNKEPIMLILSQEEKMRIGNMSPKMSKYCSFPAGSNVKLIEEFMSKRS